MAKLIAGIHHIAMTVTDFDRSVAFYRDVLGMKPVISWGEGDKRAVMLDTGDGSCLELFAGRKQKGEAGLWEHIALSVPDCDAAYQAALAAGAASRMEPTDITIESQPQPTPVRIAFVYGPDGEIVEFFSYR